MYIDTWPAYLGHFILFILGTYTTVMHNFAIITLPLAESSKWCLIRIL